GTPAQGAGASANAPAAWPAEPFEPAFSGLTGQIAIKSARLAFTPKLAARDVRGVLRFGESELALQGMEGSIAGGRAAAELAFLRRSGGLSAPTHLPPVRAR